MTQDELDNVPEMGVISREERIIDGRKVMVPVMGKAFALYQPPDKPMSVVDSLGQDWLLGYHDGVLYKSRMQITTSCRIRLTPSQEGVINPE